MACPEDRHFILGLLRDAHRVPVIANVERVHELSRLSSDRNARPHRSRTCRRVGGLLQRFFDDNPLYFIANLGEPADRDKAYATDSLEPFGSCRLCLAEVEGRGDSRGSAGGLAVPEKWVIGYATRGGSLAALATSFLTCSRQPSGTSVRSLLQPLGTAAETLRRSTRNWSPGLGAAAHAGYGLASSVVTPRPSVSGSAKASCRPACGPA